MTKAEWMAETVSKIQEDEDVLVWAILSESEKSYSTKIGRDATGEQVLMLTAGLIKYVAASMKTTPKRAALIALMYDKVREDLGDISDAEEDDDDQ